MRMNREKKTKEIRRIREDLRRSKASFFLDFRGLSVAELTEFRKMLRKERARFHVVKNSLVLLAIKDTELSDLGQFFSGCAGIVFAEKDFLASAKAIKRFSKDHSHLTVKGGLLDENVLGGDEVRSLGDLPPREILLAQILAEIEFPLRQLLRTFSAPLSSLILLLDSILEKKETYQ